MSYQVGLSTAGMFGQSDPRLPDGTLADDYVLFLQSGETVHIRVAGGPSFRVRGARFALTVRLLRGTDTVAMASGNPYDDTLLTTSVDASGFYALRISPANREEERGSYTLETQRENPNMHGMQGFQGGPMMQVPVQTPTPIRPSSLQPTLPPPPVPPIPRSAPRAR